MKGAWYGGDQLESCYTSFISYFTLNSKLLLHLPPPSAGFFRVPPRLFHDSCIPHPIELLCLGQVTGT